MKQGLALRMSQHLSLTPQLQQSIRLLQLSTLELAQEVEQMLDENPFLERDDDTAGTASEPGAVTAEDPGHEAPLSGGEFAIDSVANTADSMGLEGQNDLEFSTELGSLSWDAGEAGDAFDAAGPGGGASNADDAEASDWTSHHETLPEALHRQALSLRLSELDRAALWFLIESLNDDGYLEDSLEVLADSLLRPEGGDSDPAAQREELLQRLALALVHLQQLEPAGVGARDLAECLRLQLQAQSTDDAEDERLRRLALRICQQPLEWLAKKDVRRLTQALGCTEVQTRLAMARIAQLEPKPGRAFADVRQQPVVPDVIVRTLQPRAGEASDAGVQFSVELNPEVLPRLRVHELYASALRGHKSGDGAQALQQRLQEARWFIKNIQQRFDTILRVARAIVERQKHFFIHGELAMRPLVLRDIADALGLHESTISRVTTAKYMATPQGTYELKYFFGSGLGTETGGNASSTAVRALIKQFVAAENPAKPLSDSQLADMLKEQGIECARRTVAKYREALKIPTATLRKAL